MATRYRWVKINTNFEFDSIFEKLNSVRFSANADDWFAADPIDRYAMRYFWRTVVTTSYIDDNNIQVYQSVPTLGSLDFYLIQGTFATYIRIKNPPRTISAFMSALERIMGFGFWVENVNIMATGRSELLRSAKNARLISVKATNVRLGENVIGRVEAVSKEFISEDLLGKFSVYSHLIDFCTYEIIHDNLRGQVSFYRNGQLKVSDSVRGYVTDLMEDVFINAKEEVA